VSTLLRQDRAPKRYPDPTPARYRQDLPDLTAAAEADPNDSSKQIDHVEALLNAASCSTCAFRNYQDKTCRVHPPRPLSDGCPVWPTVAGDDWCGLWSKS
jgi:hypothetical protein